MAQKTPQDRKKPEPGHRFTVKGKTYVLPPVTEKAASSVPGGITFAAVMDPDDHEARLRLAFATLKAVEPTPEATKALMSLTTEEMLEVIGNWMGESGGSSDSSESTEEPSSTTGGPASD